MAKPDVLTQMEQERKMPSLSQQTYYHEGYEYYVLNVLCERMNSKSFQNEVSCKSILVFELKMQAPMKVGLSKS